MQQYLDIVPGEKLVHLQSFSTPEGGLGMHPMAPTWPKYMHATTTFEDAPEGGTLVTISWYPHESDEIGHQTFEAGRPGMVVGFGGTFVKLDAYLQELQS
jgi:Activator of Hsp90 ATPase homolog 1-like protein